jgi:Tol biopolymer transport system component
VFLASNVRLCRQYYGCYRDTTTPLIYFLDVRTGKVRPFHSTSDVPVTNFIAFSPDNRIAYTDLGSALTLSDPSGSRVTHVPNQGNSLDFQGFDQLGDKAAFVGQTPSSTGGDILVYWSARGGSRYIDVSRGVYDSSAPSFSASGNEVAYDAYRGEVGTQPPEPVYGINVYEFRSGRTRRLTSEKRWTDWAPVWSMDDRYVAFVRSQAQETLNLGAGEVWVVRAANGRDAHPIGGIGTAVTWVS